MMTKLKPFINSLIYLPNVHPENSTFHNAFGDQKGRIRVKNRGWINRRAHIFKKDITVDIQQLEAIDKNIQTVEEFLDLSSNNCAARFFRIKNLFVFNAEVQKNYIFDYKKTIKKLSKMVAILRLQRQEDKKNKYILNKKMEVYTTQLLNKIKKSKKKYKKTN